MSDIIYDPKAPREERAYTLMTMANEGGDDRLETLKGFLKDDDQYIRSAAVLALGHFDDSNNPLVRDRRIYNLLENMLQDQEKLVRSDAILALGESGDSRALFTLVNYYNTAPTAIKERVLLAMYSLHDSRSAEFLDEVEKNDGNNNVLVQLAQRARTKMNETVRFYYTYHGNEEIRLEAETATGMTPVNSYEDIERMSAILEEDLKYPHFKPQTYVVTADGTFVLGGYRNEHVEVAKGEAVIAAGEAGLVRNDQGIWVINYLNNRSNGYYPSKTTYHFVRKALEKSGVQFPDEFTEKFPEEGYFTEEFLCNKSLFKFWAK